MQQPWPMRQSPAAPQSTPGQPPAKPHVVGHSQMPSPSQSMFVPQQWPARSHSARPAHVVASGAGAVTHPSTGSQRATRQSSVVAQPIIRPLSHRPLRHTSANVHAFPSLHDVSSGTGVLWQPSMGEHTSAVHELPSEQSRIAPPPQVPSGRHRSPSEHRSPSSQGAAIGVCVHPATGSQASAVHGLSSSHPAATHAPAQHMASAPQRGVRAHVVGSTHSAKKHSELAQVVASQVAY